MSNVTKKIVQELSEEEQNDVLSWAQNAQIIKNNESLDRKKKLKELYQITYKNNVVLTFLKSVFRSFKKHGWDNRGWGTRLTLSGLAVGVGAVGTKMAGLASSGLAIGVPVFLLTSAGGALPGTIIDEIQRSKD